jgi:hypothetical protein
MAQERPPEQCGDPRAILVANSWSKMEHALTIVPQFKFMSWARERQLPQELLDQEKLGAWSFQESAPRRRVEKQLADLDRGPDGVRRGMEFVSPTWCCAESMTGRSTFDRRTHGDARNRRDARQRFAAKAERRDGREFFGASQFARVVARNRAAQVVTLDAATVVLDADRLQTALAQIDDNAVRASIEAVFNEFLDDRCRTLDHLTGGNLVDDVIG